MLANLVEGALVVTLVLALLLGTIRGALVVVLGIPASMAIALFGMHLFGVTGDLMSLGAIDFGFLVDGPIVILEAVMAATRGQDARSSARATAPTPRSPAAVARPVAFAVAIIMLVYLPLLSLEGIEGKMFRPMAVTMACALFGALVYSVLFFPALLVDVRAARRKARAALDRARSSDALRARARPGRCACKWALARGVGGWRSSASFVLLGARGRRLRAAHRRGRPVVTIRRAPSISLARGAKSSISRPSGCCKRFPEVVTTLGMTGRAEVAIDPVGNDNTDIFVHLQAEEGVDDRARPRRSVGR